MSLFIKFVGALGRVTGSCTWLYHEPSKSQFLVDCGMYQGETNSHLLNRKEFPFKPSELAFVLLTHAHIDHCGLLPRLYKEGFSGQVWCNAATAELAEIALEDATNLCDGLYTHEHRKRVRFKRLDDNRRAIRLADGLQVVMTRTSHILGSTAFEICWWDGDDISASKTICFTGDIGNNAKTNAYLSLLKGRQYPAPYCDYIVCESTYGEREREAHYESFENRMEALADTLEETYSAEGEPLIIIPAFSLHRTQEILADLFVLLNRFVPTQAGRFLRDNPAKEKIFTEGVTAFALERGFDGNGLSDEEKEEMQGWFEPAQQPSRWVAKASLSAEQKKKIETLFSQHVILPRIHAESSLGSKYGAVFAKWLALEKPNGDTPDYQYLNDLFLERAGIDPQWLRALLARIFTGFSPPKEGPKWLFPVAHAGNVKLEKKRPNLILSSSGMCENGPVRVRIEKNLTNPDTTILLTGFQGYGTLGERLRQVMEYQQGKQTEDFQIDLEGHFLHASKVKAKIRDLSPYYSGHADLRGILDYLLDGVADRHCRPTRIFLNHGVQSARAALKEKIEARSKNGEGRPVKAVELPGEDDRWFDLSSDCACEPPLGVRLSPTVEESGQQQPQLTQVIELLREQNELLRRTLEHIELQTASGRKRHRP